MTNQTVENNNIFFLHLKKKETISMRKRKKLPYYLITFLITVYFFSIYSQLEKKLITLKNKLEFLTTLLIKPEIDLPHKKEQAEREQKAKEQAERERQAKEQAAWLTLANDFRKYKTTNVSWHAGDLYEHSVWTALILEKWFEENKFWVADIDPQYKRIFILAGYLHDIGKGGDRKVQYNLKPEHPQTGFEYLIGKKDYRLIGVPVQKFDIPSFFTGLNLTRKEQKIITVLVGIHSDFGRNVMAEIDDYTHKNEKKKIYKAFMESISKLCKEVGITLDRQIFIMAIAINAADVKAAQEVKYKSKLFSFPKPILKPHEGSNPYENFEFDTKGKNIYGKLLEWYDQKFTISSYFQLYSEKYQNVLYDYTRKENLSLKSIEDVRAASYQILAGKILNDKPSYYSDLNNRDGYTFIDAVEGPSYFSGKRNKQTIETLEREQRFPITAKELSETKQDLVKNYKIHLMPYEKDIPKIFITLLEGIQKNPEIKNDIYTLKIKYRLDSTDHLKILSNEDILPIMVIYPASDQASAQRVLNSVYEIYKDTQGMDIRPRFNEKITSLIYYAQGDGDHKKEDGKYYKLPEKIFYKSDFVEPDTQQDFHLKNPSLKQKIRI